MADYAMTSSSGSLNTEGSPLQYFSEPDYALDDADIQTFRQGLELIVQSLPTWTDGELAPYSYTLQKLQDDLAYGIKELQDPEGLTMQYIHGDEKLKRLLPLVKHAVDRDRTRTGQEGETADGSAAGSVDGAGEQ